MKNSNQFKTTLFMATTLATVLLAFALVFLFVKHARQSREFNAFRDNIEEREKKSRILSEVPHGGVRLDEKRNRIVGRVEDYTFVYTVDPRLQNMAEEALRAFGQKHNLGSEEYAGSIVGVDASTGAVKVMASYESRRSEFFAASPWSGLLDPMARNSTFPMASIQKIVTAAAGVGLGVTTPETVEVCRGAMHVGGRTIASYTGSTSGKMSLGQAMATSCNTIFAQIALDLSRDKLEAAYRKFMFNRRLEFDLPVAESVFTVPDQEFSLAEAGSGLGGARVSPLHVALVSAAVQNKGVMMRPYLVDRIERGKELIRKAEPAPLSEPMTKDTADKVALLMEGTIEQGGTGYNGFGKPMLDQGLRRDVPAKTGTVYGACKSLKVTWFVGFVADGKPDIAFAVLLTNRVGVNLHATELAWDFFETVFHDKKIQKHDR
jgi:peptidoglycan glycosyltransferase